MEVEISKETSDQLTTASRVLGVKKDALIDRALLVYLDSISKLLNLKKEMKEWDILSDEALDNFEHSL